MVQKMMKNQHLHIILQVNNIADSEPFWVFRTATYISRSVLDDRSAFKQDCNPLT